MTFASRGSRFPIGKSTDRRLCSGYREARNTLRHRREEFPAFRQPSGQGLGDQPQVPPQGRFQRTPFSLREQTPDAKAVMKPRPDACRRKPPDAPVRAVKLAFPIVPCLRRSRLRSNDNDVRAAPPHKGLQQDKTGSFGVPTCQWRSDREVVVLPWEPLSKCRMTIQLGGIIPRSRICSFMNLEK